MNRVQLFGNVGKDPEVRHLDGGKSVAKFSLATSRSYMKDGDKITETEWHNIVFWNKQAELCEKFVKKGSSIIVEGEIRYRSYLNKDNVNVYITEILGNALHFTGKKEESKPKEETGKAEDDPSYDPFA